jgi:hypothetical protein
MQITVKIAIFGALAFAVACLGASIYGFVQTQALTDPQLVSDGRGYSFFWLFLSGVSAAIAAATWWISRPPK